MYSFIRTFLDAKITTFNGTISGTNNDLNETTVSLDLDQLPANQMHRFYQIRIKDYARDNDESNKVYKVNVEMNLTFGLYRKDVDEYENIIDDYVHPLVKLFAGTYKETNISIASIDNVQVTNLENIIKNAYLQPTISMQLVVVDAT